MKKINNFVDLKSKMAIPNNYGIHTIYHYSDIECIKYFLTPDGRVGSLKLNRLDNCNDGLEVQKISYDFMGDYTRCYISCFTYCQFESVHMWYMYGKSQQNTKCRFSFDLKRLKKLLKSDDLRLYYIKENEKIILNKGEYSIDLIRVGYCARENEGNFKCSILKIGEKIYEFDYDQISKKYKSNLTAKIKNMSWEFEKEIRIVCEITSKLVGVEELFIELPNGIVNGNVRLSPWSEIPENYLTICFVPSLLKGHLDKLK